MDRQLTDNPYTNLRLVLQDRFSDEEFRELCFDLKVEYYDLSGETRNARMLSFVGCCQEKPPLLKKTLDYIATYRPDIADLPLWEDFQRHACSIEQDYLGQIAEDCRYLALEGSDIRVPLTGVFVMLQAAQVRPRHDVELTGQRIEEMDLLGRLELGPKGEERPEREQSRGEPPPPPVEMAQALSEHTRLVILGEPGGGKTTLLRFIALCFATPGMAEEKLKLAEGRIPVSVELRRLSATEPVEQFLAEDLAAAPYHLPATTVKSWLNEGRLILLLDALDEVPSERRSAVQGQIARFAASQKWQGNRIVVSSRIAPYCEGGGPDSGHFSHYTLRPFAGPEDARTFACGWLRALGLDKREAETQAAAMIEHMEKQPGLRRIMSNPLQLRLVAEAYRQGGRKELVNRARLYRYFIEEVIKKREVERGLPQPWPVKTVVEGLKRLAWERHTAPGGRLSKDRAVALLDDVAPSGKDGRDLLDYLRQRTGLVVAYGEEKGEPLLAFSHQTYQEYLVALILSHAWATGGSKRKEVWAILKPRLHHPDWGEPILLLTELLKREDTTDLVECIQRAGSRYERVLHRDLLLTLACLADGAAVEEVASQHIAEETVAILRSKNYETFNKLLLFYGLLASPVACSYLSQNTPFSSDVSVYLGLFLVVSLLLLSFSPPFSRLLTLPLRWMSRGHYEQLKGQVAELLRETRNPYTVRLLISALDDEDWSVRQVAAGILGEIGDARAVGPLISALGDKDIFMRETAAEALVKLGVAAVEPLISALSNEGRWMRRSVAAAKNLGKLGGVVMGPLIAALSDWREGVRRAVAEALGEIGDTRAVEPLISALDDGSEYVRRAAAKALGEIGDANALWTLIFALDDEDWYVREAAGRALSEIIIKVCAVGALISALREGDLDIVRRMAAKALGEIGDAHAVEPLVFALCDKDEGVRRAAAKSLGEIGNARAVEPLISTLHDEAWRVRLATAEALSKIGDPCAVGPLISALSDEERLVRWRVAYALGELGDASAVGPLISALHDGDDKVRHSAAHALGKIKDARAVRPLISALHDEDENVRHAAAESLGELGDAHAVNPLISALRDEDENVRRVIVKALIRLGDAAVESLVSALRNEDENVRCAAAKALGEIGDARPVEPIISALRDEDEDVRCTAAKVLGEIGDTRAVGPLISTLDSDKSWVVRWAATKALGEIGDAAVEPLISALRNEDKNVRCLAAVTLGEMRNAHAVGPLNAALCGDWQVRLAAAGALSDLAANLTEEQCRAAAHHLWREAAIVYVTFYPYRIKLDLLDVYEPLDRLARRLVVLEVEKLPPPPYPES